MKESEEGELYEQPEGVVSLEVDQETVILDPSEALVRERRIWSCLQGSVGGICAEAKARVETSAVASIMGEKGRFWGVYIGFGGLGGRFQTGEVSRYTVGLPLAALLWSPVARGTWHSGAQKNHISVHKKTHTSQLYSYL